METVQFNYPAILVAALVSFVVGGAWYSPLLFAKAWMGEAGLDDAALRRAKLGKVFALAFVCSLVMAFNLSAFLGAKPSARLRLRWPALAARTRLGGDVARRHLPLPAEIADTLAHQCRLQVRGPTRSWAR